MSENIHNSVTSDTRARLVAATLAVWSDSPGTDASVRTITARANSAPSAVDYHYGSLGHLYDAAQRAALQQAADWTQGRLSAMQALNGQPLSALPCASIVAEIIDDWCERQRPLAMAMREACGFVRAGKGAAAHAAWMTLWLEFWTRAAAILGVPRHAEMMALFCDGESALHVLRWNRTLDRAMLDETAHALFAFAESGHAPPSPLRSAYRQIAEEAYGSPLAEDTVSGSLDEAAAQILLHSGFGALTFRNVAQRAGSTLGATSYYFGSKSGMVRKGFESLYRTTTGTSELLEGFTGDLLHTIVHTLSDETQPILRAYDELILHISRDPDFFDLRGALRGYHDPAASWVLEALIDRSEPVSPALAGAYASICRGIDHLGLAVPAGDARRVGIAALESFTGKAKRGDQPAR